MNKRKKRAIIFIIFLAVIVMLTLIINALSEVLFSDKNTSTKGDVFLYTPDFNSDIRNEEEYLIKDRAIRYSDGALTYEIAYDGWTNPADDAQAFMIDYINTLVSGDAKKLQTMYTEALVKDLKIPDIITEQRIYECVFTHISRKEVKEDGEIFLRYEVKVEYKIMRNDGTFRTDLASDSVKPQMLTIDDRASGCIISGVVEYSAK